MSDHALEHLKDTVDFAEAIEMLSYDDDLDPYIALRRVLFCACVLHICLFVARPLVYVLFKWLGYKRPAVFIFPRIEICVAFWTVPAIAAASARLLSLGTRAVLLGWGLLLSIPGMFLALMAVLLYVSFFKRDPQEWRVIMVSVQPVEEAPLDTLSTSIGPKPEDPPPPLLSGRATTNEALLQGPASVREKGVKSLGQRKQTRGLFEKGIRIPFSRLLTERIPLRIATMPSASGPNSTGLTVLRAVVGKPLQKTTWTPQKDEDKFLQRFGPLFEDYRVPVLSQNLPRPDAPSDPVQSKLSRVPLMTALLDYCKRVILAMICVADLDLLPLKQLILATSISFAFLLFLRVFRPFRGRWRLGLALLTEAIDCVTFSMGICVISAGTDDEGLQYRCGMAMICTQGAAYCLLMTEKLILTLREVVGAAKQYCRRHIIQAQGSGQ